MNNKAQAVSGMMGFIVGIIILFTVLSATIGPMEDAVQDTTDALNGTSGHANYSESISALPGTAYLLFLLATILGIVLVATRGL